METDVTRDTLFSWELPATPWMDVIVGVGSPWDANAELKLESVTLDWTKAPCPWLSITTYAWNACDELPDRLELDKVSIMKTLETGTPVAMEIAVEIRRFTLSEVFGWNMGKEKVNTRYNEELQSWIDFDPFPETVPEGQFWRLAVPPAQKYIAGHIKQSESSEASS